LQIHPGDSGYQGNLGAAYLQKADYAAAEAEFSSALSASTDNQTLHYNLGLALKLQDKLPEAVSELRAAEAIDPSQPDSPYTLGVTLWQMGRRRRRYRGTHKSHESEAPTMRKPSTLSAPF